MPITNAGLIRACLRDLFAERMEFTERFYARFREQAPDAGRMFVHDQAKQQLMLYAALSMTLRGLEAGRALDLELMEFGARHARLGVREEHFPVFGAVFLGTLIEFLPDRDHPQLSRAWWSSFTDMATPIIAGMRAEYEVLARERQLFRSAEDAPAVILGRRLARGGVERSLN